MSETQPPIPHLIAVAMAELGVELHRHFQQVVGEMGLTPVQAAVLRLTKEPIRMGSLAEKTHCHASHMTGVIDALEQQRWLVRTQDPNDRRVQMILRTEAGQQVEDEIIDRLSSSETHPIRNLNEQDQRTLLELLSKAIGDPARDIPSPNDH